MSCDEQTRKDFFAPCDYANNRIKSIKIVKQIGYPTHDHLKTIYDVKNCSRSLIKKIVDNEAENFIRENPGYQFFNIKVESKEGGALTYRMVFIHKNFIPQNAATK